jgi:hypothetical protein
MRRVAAVECRSVAAFFVDEAKNIALAGSFGD